MLYSSPNVFPNTFLVRIAQTLLQQYATFQTYGNEAATTGDVCPNALRYSLDKICDESVDAWFDGLTRISMHSMGDSMWIIFV